MYTCITLFILGRYYFHEDYWSDISAEAIDMIRNMLCINQKKRWTAKELLQHPWILQNDTHLAARSLTSSIVTMKKFNARRRFKAAIELVKFTNRLSRGSSGTNRVINTANLENSDRISSHNSDPDSPSMKAPPSFLSESSKSEISTHSKHGSGVGGGEGENVVLGGIVEEESKDHTHTEHTQHITQETVLHVLEGSTKESVLGQGDGDDGEGGAGSTTTTAHTTDHTATDAAVLVVHTAEVIHHTTPPSPSDVTHTHHTTDHITEHIHTIKIDNTPAPHTKLIDIIDIDTDNNTVYVHPPTKDATSETTLNTSGHTSDKESSPITLKD